MKFFPVIWAGLWRRPARSLFTLLSIAVAFVLFGLLQGLNAGFAKAIEDSELNRLITDTRVPGGPPMPISAMPKIEQVPGVTMVVPRAVLIGSVGGTQSMVLTLGFDVRKFFVMRPGLVISKQDLDTLASMPTGLVATPALQKQHGWKKGDLITLTARVPRQDGSNLWTFQLVGDVTPRVNADQIQLAFVNYKAIDDARATDRGTADRFLVQIADPHRAVETSRAIDRLFANSPHETRTRSEQELAASRLKQVGDIGFFANAIVGAVFFTLLFLTGNTMRQSVRERVPELGVLKALGYSDSKVLVIVLAEALLLCLIAAGVGLLLAACIAPFVPDIVGRVRLSAWVIAAGLGSAALVALTSASLPAWRARRLRIVDALAGR